jgi:uncharacterized protein (DUF934 family)
MPRRMLRDGEVVVDDWRTLNEAAADEDSPLMLTLDQWLAERERWITRGGRLGVILAPQHKVEMLVADLARFSLVAAEFTSLAEGRGYTQARLLRERWQFSGELRATGAIGRDQLFLLARCGFNSFELPDAGIETAAEAFATFSAAYQPANDAGLAAPLRHRWAQDLEAGV